MNIRVLLVAGGAGEASTLRDALAAAGGDAFSTHRVRSASQALTKLQAEPFELAFVDLDGDGSDELESLRLISATAANTALIAVTSNPDDQVAVEALERGAQECLVKGSDDFSPRQLVRSVRNAFVRTAHDCSRPLATLVTLSPDAIMTISRERKLTRFNAAAERLYGYSAAEVLDTTAVELIPASHQDRQTQFLDRVLAGESVEAFQFAGTNRAGEHVVISMSGSPITDAFGNVVEACVIARDVTQAVLANQRLADQQTLLESSQAAGHVGSWSIDRESGRIEWSAEHYRLLKRAPALGPMTVEELLDQIHPDDRPLAARAFKCESTFAIEAPLITDPDDVRILQIRGEYVPREDGRPGRLLGITQDITAERAEHSARLLAEEQLERTFDDALVGMAILDLNTHTIRSNRSLQEILGLTPEQMLTTTLEDVTHPDDRGDDLPVTEMLRSGVQKSHVREKRYVHADGHTIWAEVAVSWITHADGSPSHYLVQVQDITERRARIEQLRHMADHDPLTGLLNRRGFNRELESHITRTRRQGISGALAIVDLDNFKLHNDSHGHAAGDLLLVAIADTLRERLRASDVIGRLGGDEFAVLLPDLSREHANLLTSSLLDHIKRTASDTAVTASIGLVCFETLEDVTAETAMACADSAMYSAKGRGRNQYAEYASPTEGWENVC
jgi:diguanylate cyclase (GGDEF)-like protein/PAS domain S-box-containing protein